MALFDFLVNIRIPKTSSFDLYYVSTILPWAVMVFTFSTTLKLRKRNFFPHDLLMHNTSQSQVLGRFQALFWRILRSSMNPFTMSMDLVSSEKYDIHFLSCHFLDRAFVSSEILRPTFHEVLFSRWQTRQAAPAEAMTPTTHNILPRCLSGREETFGRPGLKETPFFGLPSLPTAPSDCLRLSQYLMCCGLITRIQSYYT